MKKEYNIKDQVWIHLGEKKLVEGRVVEVIDLEHLGEGHSRDRELYVIELHTGIDDVYEVRSFDQISPDAKGPIQLFRNLKEVIENNRYLKKVGMPIPMPERNALEETVSEINDEISREDDEPTPEQIHAAMERAEKARSQPFNVRPAGKRPAKKRTFNKRKKSDPGPNI
jgi:hypothetical protein